MRLGRACRRLPATAPRAANAAAPAADAAPSAPPASPFATASLSPAQLAANAALAARFKGQLVLAPLTRVGTLPFRRLATEFGASVTLSEMAFARPLARGDRVERARLRSWEGETCFGVQVATNQVRGGEGRGGERGVDRNRVAAGAIFPRCLPFFSVSLLPPLFVSLAARMTSFQSARPMPFS